jgi:chorismate lyase/3-hydroxybenzoate synthase
MLRTNASISDSPRRLARPSLTHPPRCVEELLAHATAITCGQGRILESPEFCLAEIRLAATESMDGPALQQASATAYRALRSCMSRATPWYPLRIWNFLPRILADSGNGMDRYMRFNSGRHQVFTEWLGSHGFDRALPTASAVGYEGDDLVVCALGGRVPGTPIANPRQVSPHHYSKRFGPLPPCFARATRVTRPHFGDLLLVGGTSSVRGEESVYVGDVRLQLAETLENLASLVREAFGPTGRPLEHYRALRVYHSRNSDLAALEADISTAFATVAEVEWQQAELCRGDLLVEIEGLAGPV